MATHLRMYSPTKVGLGLLPDQKQLKVQVEHNGPGTLTCGYLSSGVNADLLDADQGFLAIVVDGVEQPDWYVYEDDSDDTASEEGAGREFEIAARGMLSLFEQAEVYPQAYAPGGNLAAGDPLHAFSKSTPGAILTTLISRAQARDAIPAITVGFTATHDSAGVAWPTQYDVSYTAGLNYLELITAMCDNGWIDVRMEKFELNAYVPDTALGVDRPDVILRNGQNVTSGPRKRSRRGIITTILGTGSDNTLIEVNDASAQSKYGRREGFFSDGRMTTTGSLSTVVQQQLGNSVEIREGFTLNVLLDPPPGETWPMPGVSYFCGDRIRYDQRRLTPTTLEPLRVRTLTYEFGSPTDPPSVSIELNDLFTENAIKMNRRVQGILNGAVGDTPSVPSPPADKMAPAAPSALTVTSDVYLDAKGRTRATAFLLWTPPTTNKDGTPLRDLAAYEAYWRTDETGSHWQGMGTMAEPGAMLHNLSPGQYVRFTVRAVDQSGNRSVLAPEYRAKMSADTTPPAQPSTPDVQTRLGTVTVGWDGKDLNGAAMPGDFSRLEVHKGDGNDFTAGPATFVDYLYAAGQIVLTNEPYNVTRWYRFIALDDSDNASVPSVTASVTTKPLVDTDLIDKIIGASNLEDGAVTSVILADDAVTAAKIKAGSVDETKVTFTARDLDGTTTTTGPDQPLNPVVGDVWYDSDDGNRPRRWDGTAWVSLADKVAIQASVDASQALVDAATADGKATDASTLAQTAKTTADAAKTAADDAKAVGDQAVTNAGTAQARADLAVYGTYPSERDPNAVDQWWFTSYLPNATLTNTVTYGFSDLIGLSSTATLVPDATNIVMNVSDQYIGHIRTMVRKVAAGSITFTFTHDDGCRVYVNGSKVYDKATYTQATSLTLNLPVGWSTLDFIWTEASGGDGVFAVTPTIRSLVDEMQAPVSAAISAAAAAAADYAANNIVAAQITAGAVEAAAIKAGAVIAGKIAADAVQAGNIAADAITAREIAAATITAEQLAIGDFTNLIPNAALTAGLAGWTVYAGNSAVPSVVTTAAGVFGLRLGKSALTEADIFSEFADVIPGETLVLTYLTEGAWTTGNAAVYGNYLRADGTTSNHNPGTTGANVPGRKSYTFTVPADAVRYRARPYISNNADTTSYAIFSNMCLRRPATGELIVDGAITANKIAAHAITAEQMEAGTITAASGIIADAAITNAKIANVDAAKVTTGVLDAGRVHVGSSSTFDAGYDPKPASDLTSKWVYTGTTDIDGGDIHADTVTAVQLTAGAVTAEKLTVGSISDSVLRNPNFEELSTVDATLPAAWTRALPNDYPGPDALVAMNTTWPISGSRSVDLTVNQPGVGNQSGTIESTAFPVTEGEIWYGRLMARDSTGVSPSLLVRLSGGATPDATTHNATFINRVPVPTTATEFSGQVTIPAGMLYARFQVINYGTASTDVHTITVDKTECRKVTVSAQIGDGAITTPKLQALAVSADKLAANSVQADKIDAGAIHAEHLAFGVINSNLVPDPSFEEDYDLGSKGNAGWRLHATTGTGSIQRQKNNFSAHSGVGWLSLYVADEQSAVAVNGGAFDVVPGAAYRVQVSLASLNRDSRVSVYLMSGPTEDEAVAYATDMQYRILSRTTGMTSGNAPTTMTADTYDMIVSEELTIPDGHTRAYVRIWNETYTDPNKTYASSWVCVDDVSCVKIGYGASEITAAGLRLFGQDGTEVGAFVSNRPNYFSVTKAGETVASISGDGQAALRTLSVAGVDNTGGNTPNSGVELYGREFLDWMTDFPRGLLAWEDFGNDLGPWDIETGYGEIGFLAEPGRMYRIGFRATAENTLAGKGYSVSLRYTASSSTTTDAPAPTTSSSPILASQSTATIGAGYDFALSDYTIMSCGYDSPRNVRVLLTFQPIGGGAVNTRSYGGGQNVMGASDPNSGTILFVEDIGPERGQSGRYSMGGSSGTSGTTGSTPTAAPPPKTYTKTYSAISSATYKSNGDKRTDTSDIVQGYNSYNGNGKGLWCFPNMTTDLSGAAVKKVEIYAYASHWYYNSGGTARISLHNYTSPPASSPTLTYSMQSTSWPKPGGRWVTLPSSTWGGFASGLWRGFGMGPAPSNSLIYYGRFRGANQTYEPKIRVTYVK